MQNILGIIDKDGNLVVKYDYIAYGIINSITGTLASTIGQVNPFRYKGYYYDTETKMYYCKSRYYVPEWCRWLNGDNIHCLNLQNINGLNLFAYCGNNPVMLVDPNGDFWWLIAAVAVCVGLSLLLKSDSQPKPKPKQSSITKEDVNINETNPNGNIIVDINDSSIHITDSHRFTEQADKEKIMEIIMESESYKQKGYYRSMQSYISEWNAHNFAYAIFPWGKLGKKTGTVNLNKNPKTDPFRFVYWLF